MGCSSISTIFILYALAFIITTAKPHNHCTSIRRCKCVPLEENRIYADCSNIGLSKTPHFFKNVTSINLSHNNISILQERDNFPPGLMLLDISNNKIKQLDKTSLQGMYSLQELSLESNELRLNMKTYPPGVFKDLTGLKVLNLKNNAREKISEQYYPDTVFADLVVLETLRIDGLPYERFGPGFAEMKHLTELDISGVHGKCNLTVVTSDFFVHFPYLRILDISACSIVRIENGTFKNLSYLRQLDISYNKDLTFAVSANVSYDLQFTDIRVLKANKLHRTFGIGTQIFVKDIMYLQNTSLEELYVDSNRIELIEPGALAYMPENLTVASGADNKFTMGFYIFEFTYLKNLKVINASLQFFSHHSVDIFEDKKDGTCDEYARSPCEHLYSTKTNRSHINQNAEMFRKYGLDLKLPVPRSLEQLHFNMSMIRYRIPQLAFDTNVVKYVNFSGNILHDWKGPIKNLDKLEVLDLSNTYCSVVSSFFFLYLGSLKKLLINDNLLGFELYKDVKGETFQSLTRLNELDLSQNRIQELPRSIFRGLSNLTRLDLSFNLLRNWDFDIAHMTQLMYIDLSQNQLFSIPDNIMKDLDEISRYHNVTLDLVGNNLLCKCETLKFLRWTIETNTVVLHNFEKYQCILSNGTIISFTNLQNVVDTLELECASKIGIIVAVLVGIVVSISAITYGIIYRYRWKIRYLYYMARNKYSGYTRVPKSREDEFEFDAFVSYAEEDSCFVYNDLRSNLELGEDGVTLLIHGRDFTPGLSIAANITKAINSSRKTIIVLSKNFLRSEWCMYEFNMARMESIYNREGRNVLFIIFYENIPAKDLPMTLLELVESKSYIEYPNDPQGNIVFWNKIKETILSF